MHVPENKFWSNPFETEIPLSDDEDVPCFVQVALAATGSNQGDEPMADPLDSDSESAPALKIRRKEEHEENQEKPHMISRRL